MKELFVHPDHTKVGHYRSVLESAGIRCFIRNEVANNLAEMPAALFYPALCVIDDADYDEALRILQGLHQPSAVGGPDWQCPACGEPVPVNFESCWNCGQPAAESA